MSAWRIRRVDRRNWDAWAPVVLRTMRKVFHRKLWWTADDFEECLDNERYIFRLATIGKKFVGFCFGYTTETGTIHLFYIFIAQTFQGKGYGFTLLKDFVGQSKKKGYETLTVCAKVGPSLANFLKLGAKKVATQRNFFGTGDTYISCVMNLLSA